MKFMHFSYLATANQSVFGINKMSPNEDVVQIYWRGKNNTCSDSAVEPEQQTRATINSEQGKE